MKRFISKELFLALAIDLAVLFFFGVITADLNDDSLEAKIFVVSFFLILALVNVYLFFRHKKLVQKEVVSK